VTIWGEWRSEPGHLTLSFLPTILAYLPWVQGIINITQEPALSFFKSFPWKCSTPLNGPANAVAVMFWTAALLQDKLCSARRLSADFSAQRLGGRARQPVMARWKSLINSFTYWCWVFLKCHLPRFHPKPPFLFLHFPLPLSPPVFCTTWWTGDEWNRPKSYDWLKPGYSVQRWQGLHIWTKTRPLC
jgi:hypothetical protein